MFLQVSFVFLSLLLGANFAGAQNLLWSAGMETGDLREWSLNQCGGEFNSGVSHSEASTDVAHSGGWSTKMIISTPSSPESGVRLFRWCESRTYPQLYYSVWFYIPQSYDVPNWWNLFQWKSKTSSRNDAFYNLNIGNLQDGSMQFYLWDWQNRRSYTQSVANVPVGRWFQVEAYYSCAADQSGRVMFWQDGQLLFDIPNVPTRYADGDCQWSVNNYSDALSPTPSTIFIDDAAISLSRIGLSTFNPAPAPAPAPSVDPAPEPSSPKPCRGNAKRCRK
jgi:hypothetical protein